MRTGLQMVRLKSQFQTWHFAGFVCMHVQIAFDHSLPYPGPSFQWQRGGVMCILVMCIWHSKHLLSSLWEHQREDSFQELALQIMGKKPMQDIKVQYCSVKRKGIKSVWAVGYLKHFSSAVALVLSPAGLTTT